MKAINLYQLTRCIDSSNFSLFEKQLSRREEPLNKIRKDELETIDMLIRALLTLDANMQDFDNWFYSFSIPQISKEFDLLLLDVDRKAVNIEIKGCVTDVSKIERQLIQNRYYLSAAIDDINSYTFMRIDESHYQLYKYDNQGLHVSSIQDVLLAIRRMTTPITEGIENIFRPKDFLISPINTPNKFVNGNYFLTDQQTEIKKEICDNFSTKKQLYGLCGAAGTGKSLLLYDLAKEFSIDGPVCVIHCGKIDSAHRTLSNMLNNVDIIAAKKATINVLANYKYVLVDETQRIYSQTIDDILQVYDTVPQAVYVFAYDYAQVLSRKEKERNNPEYLRNVVGFIEKKLSKRIRSNKEVFSFISSLMTLSKRPSSIDKYDNIDVVYANNSAEANCFISDYQLKGYTFITLTPSNFATNSIDEFASNKNSHDVVGQEFDNVVVFLDDNFKYSEEGILQARKHPNPDYLFENLFFQNITRAKEKLAIVIIANQTLFDKIMTIF